jgi:phosphopantothenate---cysteine ligase (CTP)
MKILVTAGATREPIDAVRFLSNASTGATGAALTDEFSRRGHEVVHLHGESAVLPARAMGLEIFSSAADLEQRLARQLAKGAFDAVVMAAAVADYRPALIAEGKIHSDATERTLHLVRNEKILPRLKTFSPAPVLVIGFKLTVASNDEGRRQAVAAQFSAGGVDAVVHNDLTEIRSSPVHPFWLWRSADATPRRLAGVSALGEALAGMFTTSSR